MNSTLFIDLLTLFVKWWTCLLILSLRTLCLLCLFHLLEQLDDFVVASLSGKGLSSHATMVDLIHLCSHGEEELGDLHVTFARSPYQGVSAIFIGFVHVSLHHK